jgi:D-proline reductase (dithiol) PrdB
MDTDILERREEWAATFHDGWLGHYRRTGTIDWEPYHCARNSTPPAGPGVVLSRSRLMLVSSAGSYLRDGQTAFDAADPLGDYSARTYPADTPFDELAYAHDHYDHAAVEADPQVLLPLRHLADLVAEGVIGELAPSVVSFMGYQPDLARVVDETFPAILRVAQDEEVDAALLVPA